MTWLQGRINFTAFWRTFKQIPCNLAYIQTNPLWGSPPSWKSRFIILFSENRYYILQAHCKGVALFGPGSILLAKSVKNLPQLVDLVFAELWDHFITLLLLFLNFFPLQCRVVQRLDSQHAPELNYWNKNAFRIKRTLDEHIVNLKSPTFRNSSLLFFLPWSVMLSAFLLGLSIPTWRQGIPRFGAPPFTSWLSENRGGGADNWVLLYILRRLVPIGCNEKSVFGILGL